LETSKNIIIELAEEPELKEEETKDAIKVEAIEKVVKLEEKEEN
jgi:hypothetical protein